MTKMQPKTSEQKASENSNQQLDAILKRLESLESENKELKDQIAPVNTIKDGKKFYEGPRHYSFKLWGWKPVLNYTSKKKDPTRDYVYKNQYGEYVENQILELTLLWNEGKTETQEVIVTQFNDGFIRSDKMEAKVESDGVNPTAYVFNTAEFWEFSVDPRIIN